MNLANGVIKLFGRLGILSPGPEQIALMTEEQLGSLLEEKNIPAVFAGWFSLEFSDIDPAKRQAFEELRPSVEAFILDFRPSADGIPDQTTK